MKTLEDWIYLGLTYHYEPLGLEHGCDSRLHQHIITIISIFDSASLAGRGVSGHSATFYLQQRWFQHIASST